MSKGAKARRKHPLGEFHPAVRQWFEAAFPKGPTPAQQKGWPPVLAGESTLLLAPTGSGKTLAAFLIAIDRLMFPSASGAPVSEEEREREQVKVLYISPLKALAVDIERNLRAPLAGIAAIARREGLDFRAPTVGVRSGDTPPKERARMLRHPPDILITTPESLFLLLTSQARETLRAVSTVIVDEIHSIVASKRGTHLFLSLERLEQERGIEQGERPVQRIGLSATQRPLDEIARLLGGFEGVEGGDGGGGEDGESGRPRPVTIVDAGRKRALELVVEVPVEDMARLDQGRKPQPGDDEGPGANLSPGANAAAVAGQGTRTSIWPSIHPRLVELIEQHRST